MEAQCPSEYWNKLYNTSVYYRGADKFLANLLPDVLCLMVGIIRLMLVLFYIYI